MNFKTFGVGITAAFAVATGVTLATAPAEALIIGGDPNYTPTTTLPTTLTVTGEFNDGDLTGGFTNVGGLLVNSVEIKAGSLTPGFNAQYGATSAFLSNFQYGGVAAVLDLLAGDKVIHTIDALADPTTFTSTVNFVLEGNIRALVGGELLGKATGGFSANQTFLNAQPSSSNFSLDLKATPVPTPALLPGLVAMGVGMMRKRKAEALAESEA